MDQDDLRGIFLTHLQQESKQISLGQGVTQASIQVAPTFDKAEEGLIYKGQEYHYTIHLANELKSESEGKTLKSQERAIIAVGSAINKDDDILAFYTDAPDIGFHLSEQEALSSEYRVFIVDVATLEHLEFNATLSSKNLPVKLEETAGQLKMNDIAIRQNQWRIRRRFEGSGRSEVKWGWLSYVNDINSATITNTRSVIRKEVDVRRRDIGDLNSDATILIDHSAFGGIGLPNNMRYFLFAWEDDWYASRKRIQNPCHPGFELFEPNVRRKFDNEFYFRKCGVVEVDFPTVWQGPPQQLPIVEAGEFSDEVFDFYRDN